MKTRVKICGITRLQDAAAAVEYGADALGFVFYEPSPRHVSIEQAAAICRQLPPFVTTVGLFVNARADLIARAVSQTGIDLLQFHGDESAEFCASHGRPWIRAVRMKPETDLAAAQSEFGAGRGLLLDAYRPGVPGGTGETFDWQRIPPGMARRVVLALPAVVKWATAAWPVAVWQQFCQRRKNSPTPSVWFQRLPSPTVPALWRLFAPARWA